MEELKAQFCAFRSHAQQARKVFDTHSRMFPPDGSTSTLLQKTAHNFFRDLSHWLADYHIVLVTRITDEAGSGGKSNLTVKYLTKELEKKQLLAEEIKDCADNLNKYRERIVTWRNKLIAHLDKDTVMKTQEVDYRGENHPREEIDLFYNELDTFCYLVSG